MIRRHAPDLVVSMNHRETWGGSASTWPTTGTSASPRSTRRATPATAGSSPTPATRGRACAGSRWAASPTPTHFVDLGDAIERGIASLREHAAYIAGLGYDFDPDAFLRGNARAAGEPCGCEYAATFELYEL